MNDIHYNKITQAWKYLLGENFHWGYFLSEANSLRNATDNLTNKMSEMAKVSKNDHLLDIGCGIGNVSFHLNHQFGCKVDGFSNSQEGIDEAIKTKQKTNNTETNFFVRDALNNEFETGSYDVAWSLEMSHLIENKKQLIAESLRCTKKGGRIILCDLMFIRPFNSREIFQNSSKLAILQRAFGTARLETYEFYQKLFKELNISDIEFLDISDQVIPTLDKWKENSVVYRNEVLKHISVDDLKDFSDSCDILKEFYTQKIWGYGIITGKK